MKFLKYLWNVVLMCGALILLLAAVSFAQGEPIIIPSEIEFDFLFLIPALLGWFPHWLIKWAANRETTPGLGTYLLDHLGATITGLLGTVALIFGMFQANPAAFASFNIGSFLMVLTAAWSADTINSNFSGRNKPETPA